MGKLRHVAKVSAAVLIAVLFLVGGPSLSAARGGGAGLSPHVHPGPFAGSLGVVTIYPNGTVSNSSAPISVSGTTYTLTANLNGELRVLANNAIVNGAGFTVNYTVGLLGGDDCSVQLANTTHTTVENVRATNGSIGVSLINDTGASVTGVVATNLSTGIAVLNSSSVSITGNDANYSSASGVEVRASSQVTVANNWLEANGSLLYVYAGIFTTSSALTITGNHANGTSYGFEVDTSRDVLMSANNVSFDVQGVGVDQARDVAIENNVAFHTLYGAWAEYSTNVTISGNSLAYDLNPLDDYLNSELNASDNYAPYSGNLSTGGYGIFVDGSWGSTFYHNNVSRSLTEAAYIEDASGVVLLDNNLTGAVSESADLNDNLGSVTLAGNDMSAVGATPPPTYAVYADNDQGPITLDRNAMDNLYYGVLVEDSYGPTVVTNDSITNASDAAVEEEYGYGSLTVVGSNLSGSDIGVDAYECYSGALTVTSNVINGTDLGVEDDGYDEGVTSVSITNNEIAHAEDGIIGYEIEGPVSITGNDISNAVEYGVDLEYQSDGATLIADNQVPNSTDEGIYVYEGTDVSVLDNAAPNVSSYAIDVEYSYGPTQIVGNDLQHSAYQGLDLYDSYGAVLVADNNVSDSDYGLELEYNDFSTVVSDNVATNDSYGYFYNNYLSQVSGNDFLQTEELDFDYDIIGLFYHNDVNSSAFAPFSDEISGTWNAPYPVGGNYWTGYAGADHLSGPAQNVAGSDGIGDTPYTLAGQTDQYPLLTGWFNPTTTFTESGLPAGAAWSVALGGVPQSGLAGSALVFPQVDGAWTTTSFVVTGPAGFTATPSANALALRGSNLVVSVVFTPVPYQVTVNETGLPSGTAWGIYLDGAWTNGSGTGLTLSLANGSYPYTVALVSGYLATPAVGTLTVDGHAVALTIAFAAATSATYTFVETGLPSGASWTVTFDGTAKSSTTNTISFGLAAGAYSYTISGPSGYTLTPSSGAVTPSGGDVTIYVAATTSNPGTTTTSSGGSTVSSNLFYALLAGLILALILAAVGWALYARRRSTPSVGMTTTPPPPPPPAGGVRAWDESTAGAAPGAVVPPPGAGGPPPQPPR